MASTINFSGIASGIDSNALIDAVSEATRQQRVKPSQKKITELEETNSALAQLKTKLATLQSTTRNFSTINGGALTKQLTSTDETTVSGTAGNSATNGTYDITVVSRAKNATLSFDDAFTSPDQVLDATLTDPSDANRTVTFTLGASDPQTVDIVITSTTTAEQFVTQFNEHEDNTRATATLINVGTASSPSYRIVINSNSEGLDAGQITYALGSELDTNSVLKPATTSQATDASFTIAGILDPITRSTNTVSDVIPGVTLNLNSLGNAKVSITDDSAATAGKIQDFVDAYNDVVNFIKENNQITRQEDGEKVENVFSPLARERIDDNLLFSLRSALAGSTYSSGSQVRIFADLGITTERDGTLKFNKDQTQTSLGFDAAIAAEPVSVNEIFKNFADQVALTGGTIDLYIGPLRLFESVTNSNNDLVRNLNERISQAEASITKQEETLRARFARLESIIGQMQSQQTALTSALAGLPK